MKIETREEGSTVVISPSGRLDGVGAPALEAELSGVARRGRRVVLDGRGLDFISSAGLRALLVGAKACAEQGGELAIAALRPECRAVMEASGLLAFLDYYETGVAALVAGPRPRDRAGGAAIGIGERHEGPAVVLLLAGRLDSSSAPVLTARIAASVKRGGVHVVLDCEELDYISSAGLRAVLMGARACRREGGKLAVAALAPQCRTIMEMSGFLSVIDYRETREAALATMASR